MFILDVHRVFVFSRNIFFIKNRLVNNKLKLNSFYLLFLVKLFSTFKKKLMFRTFYKLNNNKLILTPSFFFSSQFFEYRNYFFNILKHNKISGFFIYRNLFKISGYYNEFTINYKAYINYNYYIINYSHNIFTSLNETLKSKDFNRIGKVKYYSEFYSNHFNFNYYFMYNLFINNSLELYKISILLYLNFIFNKNN